MAFFDCHFFSDALGLSVSAYVLLPQSAARQIGMSTGAPAAGGFRTLTLLHGLSDDHTIWMRRTSIERYAAASNLAVIMPAVGRSFYQDMHGAGAYWTFISQELPVLMRGFFPLSPLRQDTFAAGLSMGGYGALRLALAHPQAYAAAASLSGALDVSRITRQAGRKGSRLDGSEVKSMFGPSLNAEGTDADLTYIAQKAVTSGTPLPKIYMSCGTEDGLLPENRSMRDRFEKVGLSTTYSEIPGEHDWAVWDAEIQRVLRWLPSPSAP